MEVVQVVIPSCVSILISHPVIYIYIIDSFIIGGMYDSFFFRDAIVILEGYMVV